MLAAHSVQVLCHTPYSPDLAAVDIFLFRHMKDKLAGISLGQNSLKTEWEGATGAIRTEEFTIAFRR
jgi:hypothetical protein